MIDDQQRVQLQTATQLLKYFQNLTKDNLQILLMVIKHGFSVSNQ